LVEDKEQLYEIRRFTFWGSDNCEDIDIRYFYMPFIPDKIFELVGLDREKFF